MADWLRENYGLVIPLLLGAAAVWMLMPRVPRPASRVGGIVTGLAALVTARLWLTHPSDGATQTFMFYLFGAGAVGSAALMITHHNPVYAALWFALATLCTCGLFLLRSAPFLAAATVIVYAGAIIVTFLFVIMLARQHGAPLYDRQAARPFLTTVVAFAMLGGVLYTLREWDGGARTEDGRPVVRGETLLTSRYLTTPIAAEANPLNRPIENAELGTMRGLGRSLFGDYLFAVEIAGTLLLVAAVGAIALSPRRSQGTL